MSELLRRLEARDLSLWPPGSAAATRLGWLEVPRTMRRQAKELARWAATVDQDTVVLLGMGGSSLGPAVLGAVRDAFGRPAGRRLVVVDTTDPATVEAVPFEDAFVLVSSKSGTTLEPNLLFAYARSRLKDPRRYAVVTDPATPLAAEARELGVSRVFENPPDIGGRYSVLSYFGLVPAALIGYEIDELCERALDTDRAEAVDLGVGIGRAALAGRDKTTIVVPEPLRSFGLWVEQLVAESTGKQGKGCVPVPTSEREEGPDRHHVEVDLADAGGLGEQFYRFEIAIAIAGHELGIDPFDEPNVAESKENTARVLAHLPLPDVPAVGPEEVAGFLDEVVRPGDYLSLQAYLPFGLDAEMEAARRRLRDERGGMAVTAGYGPRFLHSTGQLHKGGPPSVVALQLVRRSPGPVVPVPGRDYDFGTVIAAQAIGDYESLVAHGRRVLRVACDDPGELP